MNSSSSSIPPDLDDYSAATTTILFDTPIPLLRGPAPASTSDDPSLGPYVLAFRNPQSWSSAYTACESNIAKQCEAGARVGCALTASNNCRPSLWRSLVGGAPTSAELKEREECEQREMEGCFVAAKEKCAGFAKEKCSKPFRDARVVVVAGEEKARAEIGKTLIGLVSAPAKGLRRMFGIMEVEDSGLRGAVGCKKASELLGSDPNYRWFFQQS
ncbi:hypothetical protein LINGRAHAP2_LOCUS19584 [Linum grandiflorum]